MEKEGREIASFLFLLGCRANASLCVCAAASIYGLQKQGHAVAPKPGFPESRGCSKRSSALSAAVTVRVVPPET